MGQLQQLENKVTTTQLKIQAVHYQTPKTQRKLL